MASNKLRTRIIYTSEAVDQMTYEEVKKAYTSIRHIAVERGKRLAKYGYTGTSAGKEAARLNYFPPIREMSSEAEVRQMLLDTSKWLRRRASKAAEVKKINKEKAKAFRNAGYEFINESNIADFLEFMGEMQEAYADKNYDYTRIADAWDLAQKYQIPEEEVRANFDDWMEKGNIEKIEKLGEGASAKDVRRILKEKKTKAKIKAYQQRSRKGKYVIKGRKK